MAMELFKKKKTEQDPAQGFRAKRRAILSADSGFVVKEAYKTLRTNIRFSLPQSGCHRICVTSGLPNEGKSITALNLAITLAEAGQKVVLVDGDLRRPVMARMLMENGDPGLSNLLAGMCTEEELIHKDRYPNLDVILSGAVPPNPSELLSSPRMQELIESLSAKYDYVIIHQDWADVPYVIIDSPPINVVTDACLISPLVDGVVFVVRQNKSERESVERAVGQLKMAGAKMLGLVLNGISLDEKRRNKSDRYYYRHYGYDTPPEAKTSRISNK